MHKHLRVGPFTLLTSQPDPQVPRTILLLSHYLTIPIPARQVQYLIHKHLLPYYDADGHHVDGLFTEEVVNITTGN